MVATACGGGDEPVADTAVIGSEVRESDVGAAVDSLGRQYGDDGAFAVGVFALERGYSKAQVIAGALAGTIGRDGRIDGVTPDGESLGLVIIDPGTVLLASFRAQVDGPIEVERLLDLTKSWDELSPDTQGGVRLLKVILDSIGARCGTTTFGSETSAIYCRVEDVLSAVILGISASEAAQLDIEARSAERAERESLDETQGVVLVGTGTLTTTDVGQAKTCSAEIDVRAQIFPDQTIDITYVRTVAAGIPPGGLGEGDPNQYVECIEADRSERHEGTFDVAGGTAVFPDAGEVAIDVSDSGQASLAGTLNAADLLQVWTLDVSLTECSSDCG
jgi:hypothetical protein